MTRYLKKYLVGIKSFRQWIINYLLNIFSLPRVREEIGKLAGVFQSEAGRFTSGVKGEAVETRDMFLVLTRYMRKEKLTRSEKRKFKLQLINILKGTGVVVPVMLIPLPFVSTLLLIIMDHLLLSMNIRILPSSFYPGEKRNLLTPESVEKDLHRTIHDAAEETGQK